MSIKPRNKIEEDLNLFPPLPDPPEPKIEKAQEEPLPSLDGWDVGKIISELVAMEPREAYECIHAPVTGGVALLTESDGLHHHLLHSKNLSERLLAVLSCRGKAKCHLADDITLRLLGLTSRNTKPNSPTTKANLRKDSDNFNAVRANVADDFRLLRLRWVAEANGCKREALRSLIRCWVSRRPSVFDLEPLSVEKADALRSACS